MGAVLVAEPALTESALAHFFEERNQDWLDPRSSAPPSP